MKPVENDGMLPESEVLPDVVTDTGRPVGKEDKAMVFHQLVLKKERDKQLEGFVHAYCRQGILPVFRLNMYDGILYE
jgi:hypothetical protein